MNIDELKEIIKQTLGTPHDLLVYLVLTDNENGFTSRLADIKKKALPELQEMFENFLADTVIANDDLRVCELSSATEATDIIYEYDFESYPEEIGFFKRFRIEEKAELFDFTRDSLSSLFGYIIYLGSADCGFTLFKKHYPISLINRKSFILGTIKAKNRFIKLPGDDIVRIDGSIQLLCINNTVFVLDLSMLERSMGYHELVTKAAKESAKAIGELNVIENFEVIEEMATDPFFARKLAKIKETSPVFQLKDGKKAIVDFSKAHPYLKKRFRYSEDNTQIRLDTKKSKELFIKLLNDSYLHSDLTRQYYEAASKDTLTI